VVVGGRGKVVKRPPGLSHLEFLARRLEEYAEDYWHDFDEYLEELVIMSCLKLLEHELSEEGKKALRNVEEKWRRLGNKFWKKR